jgi:hypothetical protein
LEGRAIARITFPNLCNLRESADKPSFSSFIPTRIAQLAAAGIRDCHERMNVMNVKTPM